MKDSLILLSGGFDPLHEGHIRMIQDARSIGNIVILLNSDDWLSNKKGKPFLSYFTRECVMRNLVGVIDVIEIPNDEHGSACEGIKLAHAKYHESFNLIFAKGGDRNPNSTPSLEQKLCADLEIDVMFGVGGTDKPNSSSWALKDWVDYSKSTQVSQRPWGEFEVLYDSDLCKVKRLRINPDQGISLQYHHKRSEHWYVVEGHPLVTIGHHETSLDMLSLHPGGHVDIPATMIHKLDNPTDEVVTVIEVQTGTYFGEDDIVRIKDSYGRV